MKKNEPYYLGVFLVGAYQEILGDMHNLFGDTNAVHISEKDGTYHIDQIIDGETVEEVLEYVQYKATTAQAFMAIPIWNSLGEPRNSRKNYKE